MENYIDVLALFISIISLAFAIVFSVLQQKHNKNSVRPIGQIHMLNYEDDIAVKLENYGTGPLIIKSLVCINQKSGGSSSTLISLMPKINQPWRSSMGNVDKEVIPIGGRFTLIQLQTDNDNIKAQVRTALKDIKIRVEYTDIYGSKFKEVKDLSFFGRTLIQ